MSFPSPTSSDTTDTLPTPSLPSAFMSRATIISPTLASEQEDRMTPPHEREGGHEHNHHYDPHHHHGSRNKDTPEKKEAGAGLGMGMGTGTGTGMVPSISVEMDETPTRPRRIPNHRSPVPGGGLNIRGLTLPTAGKISPELRENEEKEDERDRLAELAPSPRVAAFKAALSGPSPDIPMSPAWQSFEASPSMKNTNTASPPQRSVPSPLGPRGNERRFDPTPTHGLHARNLSLYFPSPGQAGPSAKGVKGDIFREDGNGTAEEKILPAGEDRKVFGGKGGWSFGEQNMDGQALSPEQAVRGKRRGHHHKHSLSHNFFSFLDPTVTNPALAPSSPIPRLPSPSTKSTQFPTSVPIPLQSSTSLLGSASTESSSPNRRIDPHTQLYLSVAAIEFLIGAGLWIEGQLSGWRCLAGVGYLSVFDAAGVAIRMTRDNDGSRSTRRPYGSARFTTLLYFAQSLFLVFASVYIAKESIETVLLGEGAHSHEGGGHGHGHGGEREHGHDHEGETEERSLPLLLLALSVGTSLLSGIVLGNHSKLVESVGSLFMPSVLAKSRIAESLPILRNPFTMTVAGGSAAILLGSMVIAPISLHMLDSSLSLLLTLATSALAYPITRSFAMVLLQTAPSPSSAQMLSLRQSLRSISDDRRILGIGSTRVWMIASTASTPDSIPKSRSNSINNTYTIDDSPPSSPDISSFPRKRSISADSMMGNTKLSVSVVVHVNDNVGDKDVLDVTRFVWNRVSGAVGEGEVTIAVKRGWEGMEVS